LKITSFDEYSGRYHEQIEIFF